uniref:NADH dehydrogenase subunit 5 n=1 Tax=Bostrychia tenuissima TaxID=196631 RepID=UPI002E7A4563|nr:NADH dehydrogenase subunit 5 [Bostrychia tenuissima]WQF69447.1 NADH dehydrogenase subunit 5 [Bostrychia tenuissima]
MYLTTMFLPFFSSMITGFAGRWLGFYGSSMLATSTSIASTFLSLTMFKEVGLNQTTVYIKLATWFNSDNISVNWGFLFDNVTASMTIIVTFISFLVHMYSIEYMKTDPHFPRFISTLSMFTFFMTILITSDNLTQLFVGWEGVGLVSYMLMNFWFTRTLANKAALKALIMNRMGDLGLLMTIFWIFFTFNSSDFTIIFATVPFFFDHYFSFFGFEIGIISTIGVFLVMSTVGKSAQLGLHTWLPDAMEGPTPVSALIHAATMVTAGVFLMIRFSPTVEFSFTVLNLLVLMGSFTAFFAAFTGTFQNDMKKMIAYSTCSQLGYMVFCCGLSCYNVSLFHLVNHAFFKATTFLSAGSIIHSISNEQDMRRMGGTIFFLPFTYSTMLVGSLALIGFPFTTGFYSKDVMTEISSIYRNSNLPQTTNVMTCWLGMLSTTFTAFYSTRTVFLVFMNNPNFSRVSANMILEPSYLMCSSLFILTTGSTFVGYISKEFFLGLGVDSWNHSIFTWPSNTYTIESEFLPVKMKWTPFFFTLIGFLFAAGLNLLVSNSFFMKRLSIMNKVAFFVNRKWYFDFFYNKLVVYPVLNFGYLVCFKTLDKGFFETLGPVGVTSFVKNLSLISVSSQTGKLTHYIFFMMMSLGMAIWFLMMPSSLILQKNTFLIFFISVLFIR